MIHRSFDYRRIKKHLNWPVIVSSKMIYLMEDDDGVWTLHEHEDGLMIHADMSINCRGARAAQSMRDALQWVVENTHHRKVYARIKKQVKHACRMAVMGGMIFTHEDEENRWYLWAA